MMLCRSNDEGTKYKSSKVEKLSIKKKGMGSEGRAEHMAKADTDLQLLSKADKERQLHKLKKRRLHGREEDVCKINSHISCLILRILRADMKGIVLSVYCFIFMSLKFFFNVGKSFPFINVLFTDHTAYFIL